MQLEPNTIYTDAHGRPIARPEKPAADCSIDEQIAYIRAMQEYRDKITNTANTAFAKAFRP